MTRYIVRSVDAATSFMACIDNECGSMSIAVTFDLPGFKSIVHMGRVRPEAFTMFAIKLKSLTEL